MSQKIENQLNLALDITEEERQKSESLNIGYDLEEKEWELTQEEKEFFCKMMEDYCMQKNGCTLRELFEKYGHSTSEI